MAENTRDELIESLRHSQQIVARLLDLTADIQDWQREPAEWSFRLTAAHLATIERDCHLDRIKQVAAGSHPHFTPFVSTYLDQDGVDLAVSLAEWATVRCQLFDFVASLSDEELRYTGTHDTLGTVTVIDLLKELSALDDRQFRYVEQLIRDYLEEVSVV